MFPNDLSQTASFHPQPDPSLPARARLPFPQILATPRPATRQAPLLARLGQWMVITGRKLRRQHNLRHSAALPH